MGRNDKHNAKNPSIRGASRKSEMDLKKKLHKQSGGRPARLKQLLAAEAEAQEAELLALKKRAEEETKAKAKKPKKSSKKSKE